MPMYDCTVFALAEGEVRTVATFPFDHDGPAGPAAWSWAAASSNRASPPAPAWRAGSISGPDGEWRRRTFWDKPTSVVERPLPTLTAGPPQPSAPGLEWGSGPGLVHVSSVEEPIG